MAFSQGSATAGTLILALSAWLLSNAPPGPEQLWPYLLFGAVFVILLAHIIHIVVEDTVGFFAAVLHGVPVALAAYWLGGTPYHWLAYACWAYAAAYVILVPRMIRAVSRAEHLNGQSSRRGHHRHGGFDLQDAGIAMLLVVMTAGIIMSTGLVTREWGIYAGVGAFLLWPLTLIVVPWYAALAHAEWLMVAIVHGGGTAGVLLYRAARAQRRHDATAIPRSLSEEP
ncbi:MAG TPA: hypothetical protein VJ834_02340 [Burkholderiales bacterium]|nr:hypothetical protein [Burkholderiales bacterium]